MSWVDWETGTLDDSVDDRKHIRKVEIRNHALRIDIHGKGDEVNISRAFPISKYGSLYAVSAREYAQLSRGYSATYTPSMHASPRTDRHTSIVVSMQTDDTLLPLADHPAKPLDLTQSVNTFSTFNGSPDRRSSSELKSLL